MPKSTHTLASKAWPFDVERPTEGHRTSLTVDGIRRSLAEWYAVSGVPVDKIRRRLKEGKTPQEAITLLPPKVKEPSDQRARKVCFARRTMVPFDGRAMTVEDWAGIVGISFVELLRKLNAGESPEACFTVAPRPEPVRHMKPAPSGFPRARMRVPTIAELDAMREAA